MDHARVSIIVKGLRRALFVLIGLLLFMACAQSSKVGSILSDASLPSSVLPPGPAGTPLVTPPPGTPLPGPSTPPGTPPPGPSNPPAPTGAPTVALFAGSQVLLINSASNNNGNKIYLSWDAQGAVSCTASGDWSGSQPAHGNYWSPDMTYSNTGTNTYNFKLTCINSNGSSSASTSVTVYKSASAIPLACGGTAANTSWVYKDGVFVWPGDFTGQGSTIDYQDTGGLPLTGPFDIKVTRTTDQWGVQWLPWSPNWYFYVKGCNYLTYAVKPTIVNAKFGSSFMMVGDVTSATNPDGTTSSTKDVNLPNAVYGPATFTPNQWNTVKIPLQDFFNGEVPQTIYKFWIIDQGVWVNTSSVYNNTWYIDNVGFTAN